METTTPQTVLITGANRGIGIELVKQYAESGRHVLACCRQLEKSIALQELQKKHPNIKICLLDVVDSNQIAQLSEQLKNESIDILFNNAGIAGNDKSFNDLQYEDLLTTFKVNTCAPIMLAQAFLDHIARSDSKLIVNISSVLGSIQLNQEDSWGWIDYRISKAALNAASKSMANQLKNKGITVVSMHPGWVQTNMGGKNAAISPETSVQGIRNVLSSITLANSGEFLSFNGKQLPW